MRQSFFAYFLFIFIAVLLVMVLKFLNWVPMLMQKETMRPYSNTQEIRTKLNIQEIYVPSYFPQKLSWPPSLLLAQGKPFPAVIMEFNDGETGEPLLVILQAALEAPSIPVRKIQIVQVEEKADVSLKGRQAHLEVGRCEDLGLCSRLRWQEEAFDMDIAMKAAPFDLIKIAESMLREAGKPIKPE